MKEKKYLLNECISYKRENLSCRCVCVGGQKQQKKRKRVEKIMLLLCFLKNNNNLTPTIINHHQFSVDKKSEALKGVCEGASRSLCLRVWYASEVGI